MKNFNQDTITRNDFTVVRLSGPHSGALKISRKVQKILEEELLNLGVFTKNTFTVSEIELVAQPDSLILIRVVSDSDVSFGVYLKHCWIIENREIHNIYVIAAQIVQDDYKQYMSSNMQI